ncbi:hypothetical protein BKA82DRAFT_137503 [Pisolithus tinctorius]|uniref:Uncharacterized protein n=1 Tax=Pisolithus tinctorius Marx 270 TaxID=870435 RepID=A0A0C3PGW0_PISTI|nr:hypothetical protein BKA82DRAFT_137503 [Pisolithus tinctorius]KIO07204.1 hypothetical protein M404DRAFT_137503 [Pisolithus tinctorius Marx 270]
MHGHLEVRANEQHVWDLKCPAGCWVNSGIHAHIPLSSKGQFSTLESHWGEKSCQGKMTKIMQADSRKTLTMTFPLCKNSLVSISLPVSTSSTPCCLGLQIDSWPGTPAVLITANFPWLRTHDGPDKLPFQVELIDGVVFVHTENCFRFSNVPELSVCLACDALAPKVTALAELARDRNKYTRRSLLTPMQLLEVAKNLDDQANTLKLQVWRCSPIHDIDQY